MRQRIRTLIAISILSIHSLAEAQAQTPSPRIRAREAEVDIAPNKRIFPVDNSEGEYAERVGSFVLSAIELKYGFSLINKLATGKTQFTLLRGAAGLYVLIDGIARAYITIEHGEPTISPILTLAELKLGLVERKDILAANHNSFRLPTEEVPASKTFNYDIPFDPIFGQNTGAKNAAAEILLGLFFRIGAYTARLENQKTFKVVGAILLADGAIRMGAHLAKHETSTQIPLISFGWDRIRNEGQILERTIDNWHSGE